MSEVISFLESLGRDVDGLSAGEFAARVASLEVGEELRDALLARDEQAISALLGGRSNVYCLLVPAEDDDKQDDDKDSDEPDKETNRAA